MDITTSIRPSSLLERSTSNAAFSLASGLALLFAAPRLAAVVGPPAVALAAVGAGVAAFGAWVLWGARGDPVGTRRVALGADVAWVGATVVLAPLVGHVFTVPGRWPAIVVADLAILELVGLRRSGPRS